jgi:hypothetical protein
MTEKGFARLVSDFNGFGHDIPAIPYLRVRIQMLTTAGEILRREIRLNEYEELFRSDPDPEVSGAVEDMNAFVSLVLPDINEGRYPDIEKAARKAGVHIDTARDLVNMMMKKMDELPESLKDTSGSGKKADQFGGKPVPGEDGEAGSVYAPIRTIRDLEPWDRLYESDLFGVEMPGSGRLYFISVMGSEGEYPAVAAYVGYEGLFGFSEFQENAEKLPPETILQIPHLLLSFTDREEVDLENLDAIRKAGESFRGKGRWPVLEECVPGYVPVYPGQETLGDLPVLLGQVASFLPEAMDDPEMLLRETGSGHEILIRTPRRKAGKLLWINRYMYPDPEKVIRRYKFNYQRETCAGISRLKESPKILQVDLVMLPAPVKEKGKKGYFPFVLLMVDKENGMIPGMAMLTPEPDLHSMHESVPQKLLEEIAKMGFRPQKIEFRSEMLFNFAQGALKQAWCMPVLVEEMPLMEEAVESLCSNL